MRSSTHRGVNLLLIDWIVELHYLLTVEMIEMVEMKDAQPMGNGEESYRMDLRHCNLNLDNMHVTLYQIRSSQCVPANWYNLVPIILQWRRNGFVKSPMIGPCIDNNH